METDKKNEEKEKSIKLLEDLLTIQKCEAAFYPLLKIIIGDNTINKKNQKTFLNKIKDYKKNKSGQLTTLNKKLLDLLIFINPSQKTFLNFENRKFIINIMSYLAAKKGYHFFEKNEKRNEHIVDLSKIIKKEIIYNNSGADQKKMDEMYSDAEEVLMMCKEIFKNDDLLKNLFVDCSNIPNKEEYLEMILLFLSEMKYQKILTVISSKLKTDANKDKIYNLFVYIFTNIDLFIYDGIVFLREVLILYLKDKINFLNSFKELEKKFQMKNMSLRCIQCFSLPFFSMSSDEAIHISYKCDHYKGIIEEHKLKEIQNYLFNCTCCKRPILICNSNYLCSNCKKIVCKRCLRNHFEKCASLFLYIIDDNIDNKCIEHKETYDSYCGICEINLCKTCRSEHGHRVEKENSINLIEKDKEKFLDMVKNDKKSNKIIISSIINILAKNKDKIYDNFQFCHFVKKMLKIETKPNGGFFNDFFDKEFNEYYKFIIDRIDKGDEFFLTVLKKIKTLYKTKNMNVNVNMNENINNNYSNYIVESSFDVLNTKFNINKENTKKLLLLNKYFETNYNIEIQNKILETMSDVKTGMMNLEENKILIECILNSETVYQKELLKLINRSMAESIIIYIIEKYSNKLKKMELNLGMYADLEKYLKNEPERLNKIKNDFRDKINSFFPENANNNVNINTENSNTNKIMFKEPITIGKEKIDLVELNELLEFLFYLKEKGNVVAHPKTFHEAQISSNKHELKGTNGTESLEDVKKNMKDLLQNEYVIKGFNSPLNPKEIFDCIFKSNIKNLVNSRSDEQLNIEIKNIIDKSLNQAYELSKEEKELNIFSKKIEHLIEIKNELIDYDNSTEITHENQELLKDFLKRLNKVLENEENTRVFLENLDKNNYQSSVTGANYFFISFCIDYVIRKIIPKIKDNISKYKKIKEKLISEIQRKEKIISFLTNLKKNLSDLNKSVKPIIDIEEASNYIKLDWTHSNNCNLTTYAFLCQNK